MLKFINLSGIILLLGWISFVPQPLQVHWQILVRFLLIILLGLSIIRKLPSIKLIFNKEDIPLWIFMLCMLAGVFSAENLKVAMKQYLDLFIPLFLLYYLMKLGFAPENRRPIVKTICLFSAIVALLGILEWLFHKNPIYEYFDLFDLYYRAFLGSRAMSTQTHPAVLGSYLVACLPFSFLLLKRRNLSDRWLGVLGLALGMIGMILTFSRGSLFGAIALFWVYFWQKNRILFIKYFIIVLAIFILIFSFSKGPYVFQRFGIEGLTITNTPVFKSRIARIITSYKMLKEHPFVGVGLNHFRIKCNAYSPVQRDEDGKVPDNVYLLFLAETGIIGFLGFILFIGYLLKKGFQHFYSMKSEDSKDMLIAIIAGLTGLLVNMNTYDLLYWTTPLYLFSILAGMLSSYYEV